MLGASGASAFFFTCFCLCDEAWLLLSERFTVVADFQRGGLTSSVLNIASLLGEAKIDGLVAEKLEAALQKLQEQVSVHCHLSSLTQFPTARKPDRTKT